MCFAPAVVIRPAFFITVIGGCCACVSPLRCTVAWLKRISLSCRGQGVTFLCCNIGCLCGEWLRVSKFCNPFVLLFQEYEIHRKYQEYNGYQVVPLQCLALEEYRYYDTEYKARDYFLYYLELYQ